MKAVLALSGSICNYSVELSWSEIKVWSSTGRRSELKILFFKALNTKKSFHNFKFLDLFLKFCSFSSPKQSLVTIMIDYVKFRPSLVLAGFARCRYHVGKAD